MSSSRRKKTVHNLQTRVFRLNAVLGGPNEKNGFRVKKGFVSFINFQTFSAVKRQHPQMMCSQKKIL